MVPKDQRYYTLWSRSSINEAKWFVALLDNDVEMMNTLEQAPSWDVKIEVDPTPRPAPPPPPTRLHYSSSGEANAPRA